MSFLKVFDQLLSDHECESLVTFFEKNLMIDFIDRGNAEYFRVEHDDPELAESLWSRIENEVPKTFKGERVVGLNSHFRMSKYEPGMQFGIHKDGINQNSLGHRSVMTLNIFLNENFDGGETDFFLDDKTLRFSAKPQMGRGALFDSQQYHCGNVVSNGCKYLLRTDVMGVSETPSYSTEH